MGKTVTSYLINGDPKGTQYSFITNKICLMLEPPNKAQRCCASTPHNHNEERRFLSALIGHFPKNFPPFHPH